MVQVTLFTIVALLAGAHAVPLEADSWNALLGADDLFHPEINTIQSKSNEKAVLLDELKTVLGQSGVLDTVYNKFLVSYEKKSEDPPTRIQILHSNLLEIASHNLDAQRGLQSWSKGVNQFSDLTGKEFLSLVTVKFDNATFALMNAQLNPTVAQFPPAQDESVNWFEQGKVASVKNQGSCGSCTTFACTSTVEAASAIAKDGSPTDLSPQELLDCAVKGDNCRGMYPEDAFKYVNSKGLSTLKAYPYKAKSGTCKVPKGEKTKIASWAAVEKNEDSLKDALAQRPVAVVVEVTQEFQSYKSGVFSPKEECSGNSLNHAVSLVGYGNQDGQDTWLIKNSWGAKWGAKGFITLKRGEDQCGVSKWAITPTI